MLKKWRLLFILSAFIILFDLKALDDKGIPVSQLIKEFSFDFLWNHGTGDILLYKEWIFYQFKLRVPWVVRNAEEVYTLRQAPWMDETGSIFIDFEDYQDFSQSIKNLEESLHTISTIIIDPGHGGKDSGANYTYRKNKTRYTLVEKDIALKIALYLNTILKKKYPRKNIILTRQKDLTMSLQDRIDIANSFYPKPPNRMIYISIHLNASPKHDAHGFEVWYSKSGVNNPLAKSQPKSIQSVVNVLLNQEYLEESKKLSHVILNTFQKDWGTKLTNRGVKRNDWAVVTRSRMASSLVEVAFLDNAQDYFFLNQDKYLYRFSQTLGDAIQIFIQDQFPT